mgnify:FL=1
MKHKNHERDIFFDTLIYSILFYILSDKNTYMYTKNILPNSIKDRTFLHAFVFAFAYGMIRMILKR